MDRQFDFLVIGSGIAGLSFALKCAPLGSVALITKAHSEDGSTNRAQGGMASAGSKPSAPWPKTAPKSSAS